MVKRKKTRRVISAIAAAFILLSSTVYVPGDYLQEDKTSLAATVPVTEEETRVDSSFEIEPYEDIAGDDSSEDMSSGDVTMDELNFPDEGAVNPTSRTSGGVESEAEPDAREDAEDVEAEDADADAEDAEVEEEVEEVEGTGRPSMDVITPDDMKTGDLIKKNTFINMYDYDSYTLVIDGCVIEDYEEPDEESDTEYDDEYLGFTLPDNALVVEPPKSEADTDERSDFGGGFFSFGEPDKKGSDTIYLETIYRGKQVLTETVFRTLFSMGEDITLGGDLVLTEPLVIEDGATHTIDLNGNDIFLDEESGVEGSVITIKNRSKLILKDSGRGDPGEIRGGKAERGGGIFVDVMSTLEMTGGAIVKNTAIEGAGLYVAEDASASLSGVLVSLNNDGASLSKNMAGGGIFIFENGRCKLTGCTIESNFSYDGGGIFSYCDHGYGRLQMTDTTVNANHADHYGGGICSYGNAVIENSVITANDTVYDGGGIYNGMELVMTDTEVSANTAKECGGGVCVNHKREYGKTICSGKSRIIQNNSEFGGGVFIACGAASEYFVKTRFGISSMGKPYGHWFSSMRSRGKYNESFSGIEISQNHSNSGGGGMYFEGNLPEVKIDSTLIEGNFSGDHGGGIYTESSVSITDSSIRQNSTSYGYGGGIFADYEVYCDDVDLTITNSTISENTAYERSGTGIYMRPCEYAGFILGGGKTVIAMNGQVDQSVSSKDRDDSDLAFYTSVMMKIKGTLKEGSLISFAYREASDKKIVTEGYYEYNDKPIDTYFEYAGKDFIIDPNDKLGEIQLKKRLRPTADGYKVKVYIKVTDDADGWKDAHVEFWGKRNNGSGDEYCVHSTDDIKVALDDHGGWVGEVDYGDTFPSRINVYTNFSSGVDHRDFAANVYVEVNDDEIATSHIDIDTWGNTASNGLANNWIKIGGNKYPYPEELELVKKREIDLLNESSKVVEISCVDQYGVKFQPPSADAFRIENLSFPGEDTYQCLDTNHGSKWKFDTTKKDECHNSVYLMKFKSGSSLYPWIELRIPVRFKVPLRLNVMMMNEDGETYSNLYTKEGRQNEAFDITGLTLPVGYKIKGVKKDGACDFQNPNGNYKNCKMTFFTQNVTLKFETDQIKYTIKYDRNGDKKTVTGNISSKSHKYSEFVKIEDNKFKCKSGYKFAGWNTEPDGSGVSYAPGDKVSKLSSVNGASVTLYAQWKDADGNLVTASLFSEGNMGLKVGALLSMALVVIAGVRFSVMKRKAK